MKRRNAPKRWITAQATVGTTAGSCVVPLSRTASAENRALDLKMITAVTGTIVPRDDSPAASDAGVAAMLAPTIKRQLRLRRYYVSGTVALNRSSLDTRITSDPTFEQRISRPIGCRDLELHYVQAERILGMAGGPGNPHKPPRSL